METRAIYADLITDYLTGFKFIVCYLAPLIARTRLPTAPITKAIGQRITAIMKKTGSSVWSQPLTRLCATTLTGKPTTATRTMSRKTLSKRSTSFV